MPFVSIDYFVASDDEWRQRFRQNLSDKRNQHRYRRFMEQPGGTQAALEATGFHARVGHEANPRQRHHAVARWIELHAEVGVADGAAALDAGVEPAQAEEQADEADRGEDVEEHAEGRESDGRGEHQEQVGGDEDVVDLVVEWEVGDVFAGVGDGELAFERDLVRQAVQVQQVILDRRIDRPDRQAGADAGLAEDPLAIVKIKRFAPVRRLAEDERHNLHRPSVDRQL